MDFPRDRRRQRFRRNDLARAPDRPREGGGQVGRRRQHVQLDRRRHRRVARANQHTAAALWRPIGLEDRQRWSRIAELVDPRVDRRVNQLEVGRWQPRCRADVGERLHQVARQLAGATNQPAQQPLQIARVGQTDETRCELPIHERGGMVREVLTHLRAVQHGIDPHRAQMLGTPRQLQQLRCAVCACAQYDFTTCRRGVESPAALVPHADRRPLRMTTRRTSAPLTNEKFSRRRAASR